ncbi:hypothetical protein SCLARK_00910 [Spiroplasma clarkii]|uniref:hypothetical protein n=1 Tax=Spiroplasma clarkii TaxID=2139 RepID=UPI000B57C8DE|nr:hypothetical protein [Spiroplasma clarkii]ARU91519.1 hypothetical protein SCLARK_00910 [Spiroplasma clarkii]
MKKILSLLSAITLIGPAVITTTSCSFFKMNELDKLLSFREIDYNDPSNIPVMIRMQDDVLAYRANYFKNIQLAVRAEYEKYYQQLANKEKIDVDITQNTKVPVKSGSVDYVYLGQQAMGNYYPRATELHEINRYEVPNFRALNDLGYTLYINNSNDEKIEIINVDASKKAIKHNDLVYQPLTNTNKTDCVYFRTTNNVTEKQPLVLQNENSLQ